MPAKSQAELRLMRAAEHNPAFAKKVGIKQSVAREIADATPKTAKLPERVPPKRAK